MKRFLLLALVVVIAGVSIPVSAQQEISFDSVQVQFWPEYDRPSMLVIFTLELPEIISLPVDVTVKIPASAGIPNAVAVAEGEQLLTAEYNREVIGEWAEIVVSADSYLVHIEYYDPGLEFDNFNRAYNFTWISSYAVERLLLRVQMPVGAAKMEFSADMGFPELANDGLSYYLGNFGSMAAGEQFDFSMQYQKGSDTLTIDSFSSQNSGLVSQTDENGSLFNEILPWMWLVIGVGLLLLGTGVWFLVKDSSGKSKRKHSKNSQRKRAISNGHHGKKAKRFCHNCGTAAFREDKFCRECGAKLRV